MISELMVGEIHTGLLQNSSPLTTEATTELLALIPEHGVRTWELPMRQTVSPERLTGVDCRLPSRRQAKVRCVGTVCSDVWVTGGQLLQSSSRAWIVPAQHRRRLSWSYYLSRPGVLEAFAELRTDDVIDGFFTTGRPAAVLDLDAISGRAMNAVQMSALLDRRPPFKAARSKLRWSLQPPKGSERIRFTLEGEGLRTIRLEASEHDRLPELCSDLARHDWLLAALIAVVDVARTSRKDKTEVIRRLRPAVDHLLHAWMPMVRLAPELVGFWEEVERLAGLSRRWQSEVGRIRDQVALAAADFLSAPPPVITLPPDQPAARAARTPDPPPGNDRGKPARPR